MAAENPMPHPTRQNHYFLLFVLVAALIVTLVWFCMPEIH